MAVRVRVPLAALSLLFYDMKHISYLFLIAVISSLVSCGAGKGRFRLKGKILHINQGELYVYSPDGVMEGMDTIKIEAGRFTFETPCKNEGTLMLVFPNFSEHPIFAASGKTVEIKTDASHLKEMEVTGTDENELMTEFRQQTTSDSPPQLKKHATQFIKDHPASLVSVCLVRQYFVKSQTPDYRQALSLIDLMLREQPKNGSLTRMKQLLRGVGATTVGSRLPTFTAYDTRGRLVSSTTLAAAPVAVINVWASWNYDSQDIQRRLQTLQRRSGGRLFVLGLSLDAGKSDCKDALRRDSITYANVCSGEMLEDKTVTKLGLTAIPDNIVLKNGRIVARSLRADELEKKVKELLGLK